MINPQPAPVSLIDGKLVCNQCGQPMKARRMRIGDRSEVIEETTLVGYMSPPGHSHDDNCWTREYICPNGHTMKIGKLRKCPVCDWVGKESCGCHDCIKVNEFPDDA